MYKLKNWINIYKIDWIGLSKNPSDGAIRLLEINKDLIDWWNLS